MMEERKSNLKNIKTMNKNNEYYKKCKTIFYNKK